MKIIVLLPLLLSTLLAGSIQGLISDEDTGVPLQGINVTLYSFDEIAGFWSWTDSTSTNASGAYTFTDVADGEYRVSFADGDEIYLTETWYDDAGTPFDWPPRGQSVIITGSSVYTLDAELEKGFTIAGSVTLSPSNAQVSRGINIYKFVDEFGGYWSFVGSTFYTDTSGNYTSPPLSSGRYKVEFSTPGYVKEIWDDQRGGVWETGAEIIVSDSDVSGINATLHLGGAISGSVTDLSGNPLSGIRVDVYENRGGSWWQYNGIDTTSDGHYVLDGLPAGSFRVRFSDQGGPFIDEVWDDQIGDVFSEGATIELDIGQSISDVNAELELGGSLSGELTDRAGEPIPFLNVNLYRLNEGTWEWAGGSETDENGAYVVQGLPSGTYRVQLNDYSNNVFVGHTYGDISANWVGAGGQDLAIIAGQQTTLAVYTMPEWATLTGTITAADGGAPVGNIRVHLVDGVTYNPQNFYYNALTDSSGNFTLNFVRPGIYRMLARNEETSMNVLSEWYPDTLFVPGLGSVPVPPETTPLTVSSGAVLNDINFELDTGSVVEGEVFSQGGLKLEGVELVYSSRESGYEFQLVTDMEGRYRADKVIPGVYDRKTVATGFQDEWYNGAKHKDQATPYVIPPASLLEEDIELEPGQSPAYVTVLSDPAGADVFFNYHPTGEVTPVTLDVGEIEGLNVASHVITVWKSGSPRPSPQTVPAVEAETVDMMFDLTGSATGSLSIDSSPQGATVYVDMADTPEGLTPITVSNLAPGSHVVLLKREGSLLPRPVVARVEADATTSVSLPLTPLGEPGLEVTATSQPDGMDVFVDYLPTGEVTDVMIGILDPASHSGSGWHSASHTVILSHPEWGVGAPRYVSDENLFIHQNASFEEATDEDNNGLPDQWEEAYDFANQAPADQQGAEDDADGDGVSNGDELKMGTNPLSAASKVEAKELTVEKEGNTDKVTMSFQTVPGRSYVVQTTSELGASWINISGVVRATSTTTTFVIMLPPDTVPKFYRLLIL